MYALTAIRAQQQLLLPAPQMQLLEFVQTLKNQRVKIATKGPQTVEGTVDNVDAYMNVYLRECTLMEENMDDKKLDQIVVRGASIRDIQLSDDANVDLLLAKAHAKAQQKSKQNSTKQ